MEWGDTGQRVGTSSLTSSGNLTYRMVIIANNSVLYSWKLLEQYILNIPNTHTHAHTQMVIMW